jgi:hypothetical protein
MMTGAGCSKDGGYYSADMSGGGSGGGSMARFTISGDWLYTVNDRQLSVVSIADPKHPVEGERLSVGFDMETIFPMDTLLFLGSQSGMYIYNIKNREFPKQLSVTTHFRSCDPVVAADTLAFVTLNGALGTWCGGSQNVFQVYNIKDLQAPKLLCELSMSSPRGLAVDLENKLVFVCDNGIKAIDISDPGKAEIVYSALSLPDVGKIDAYDCIVRDGRLIVVGAAGLYQLGYDSEKFSFISKIDIRREQ